MQHHVDIHCNDIDSLRPRKSRLYLAKKGGYNPILSEGAQISLKIRRAKVTSLLFKSSLRGGLFEVQLHCSVAG